MQLPHLKSSTVLHCLPVKITIYLSSHLLQSQGVTQFPEPQGLTSTKNKLSCQASPQRTPDHLSHFSLAITCPRKTSLAQTELGVPAKPPKYPISFLNSTFHTD